MKTIYRPVVAKILNELSSPSEKERVMSENDLHSELDYYAFMCGRMSVICEWILEPDVIIAD